MAERWVRQGARPGCQGLGALGQAVPRRVRGAGRAGCAEALKAAGSPYRRARTKALPVQKAASASQSGKGARALHAPNPRRALAHDTKTRAHRQIVQRKQQPTVAT